MLNINFFKPQGPFNLEDLTENAFSNEGIKISFLDEYEGKKK